MSNIFRCGYDEINILKVSVSNQFLFINWNKVSGDENFYESICHISKIDLQFEKYKESEVYSIDGVKINKSAWNDIKLLILTN